MVDTVGLANLLRGRVSRGVSAYITISFLILASIAVFLVAYIFIDNYLSIHRVKYVGITAVTIMNVFKGDPVIPVLVVLVRNDGGSAAVVDTAYVITDDGVSRVSIGPYRIPAGGSKLVVVPTNLSKNEVFRIRLTGKEVIASSSSGLRLTDLPTLEVLNRSTVTITEESGNTLTDYAVNVTLTPSWKGWGNVKSDGSDIFFVDSNGNPLYYWIEEFNYSGKHARIWVKVPRIPANSKVRIYLYYGYSKYLSRNPYSSYDNPHDVFIFFDSFESWSGWLRIDAGIVEQSSACVFSGNYSLIKTGTSSANCDPSGGYKALPKSVTTDWALEAWMDRTSNPVTCEWDRIGLINALGDGYGIGLYTGIPPPGSTTPGTPAIWVDVRQDFSAVARLGVTYGSTTFYNEWYFVRLYRVGSTLNATAWLANGVKIISTQVTDTRYSTFGYVYVSGGFPYYVDNLRVRPYVNPEPSVSVS